MNCGHQVFQHVIGFACITLLILKKSTFRCVKKMSIFMSISVSVRHSHILARVYVVVDVDVYMFMSFVS